MRRTALLVALATCVSVTVSTVVSAQTELITRAKKLDAQGQQAEAIALYRQALTRAPKSFDANYGIARALDLNGSYAEARTYFAKAIELARDEGSRDQAERMMGVSWTFVGNAREATPYFTRVFDRRAAAGDLAGAAEVANELGRVLLELGDPTGAFRWYETGYKTALRTPKPSPAETNLAELRWVHAQARIAIRRHDAKTARQQIARFTSILGKGTNDDQRVQYPYLTGYVAFHSQEYARALSDLKQADQQDPFIVFLVAEASEHLGKHADAREHYAKVLASTSHAVSNAFVREAARRKLAAAHSAP